MAKKRHTSEKRCAPNKRNTLKKRLAPKETQIGPTLTTIPEHPEHPENKLLTSENLQNLRCENMKGDKVRVRQYPLLYANLES
jgi:hypothetical protein